MNRLLVFLIAIGVVNFIIFEAVAVLVGGRAANGKVEGGRFYVADHGQYTEVSKEFFDYSRMHGTWTFRGFLLSLGSVVLFGYLKIKDDQRRERQGRQRYPISKYPLPAAAASCGDGTEPVQGAERMTGHNLRMALFSVATVVLFVAGAVGLYRVWFVVGAVSLCRVWFFFAVLFAYLLYNERRGWRG